MKEETEPTYKITGLNAKEVELIGRERWRTEYSKKKINRIKIVLPTLILIVIILSLALNLPIFIPYLAMAFLGGYTLIEIWISGRKALKAGREFLNEFNHE